MGQVEQAITPPIDTVQFHFGGRTYDLAADLMCEYVLDQKGMGLREAINQMIAPGGSKVAIMSEIFTAMVAHNFDPDKGEKIRSTESWLKALNSQPDAFRDACKAVGEVVAKLLLASKSLPTSPASETEPAVQ